MKNLSLGQGHMMGRLQLRGLLLSRLPCHFDLVDAEIQWSKVLSMQKIVIAPMSHSLSMTTKNLSHPAMNIARTLKGHHAYHVKVKQGSPPYLILEVGIKI